MLVDGCRCGCGSSLGCMAHFWCCCWGAASALRPPQPPTTMSTSHSPTDPTCGSMGGGYAWAWAQRGAAALAGPPGYSPSRPCLTQTTPRTRHRGLSTARRDLAIVLSRCVRRRVLLKQRHELDRGVMSAAWTSSTRRPRPPQNRRSAHPRVLLEQRALKGQCWRMAA